MEVKIFCGYMLLCGSLFVIAPQLPVEGTFPSLEGAGKDIAKVYAQVVGFQMLQGLLVQCPGPRGIQMAMLAIIGGMAYHIFTLNVIPPLPVMVGVTIVFITTTASTKGKLSQYGPWLRLSLASPPSSLLPPRGLYERVCTRLRVKETGRERGRG
jgi:hypothetical protein